MTEEDYDGSEFDLQQCPDCLGGGGYKCDRCGGCGWESEAQHDPDCDGSCRSCPIEVQVPCRDCYRGICECPTCKGNGSV